jgi:DNA-binding NtrC family response regulator
MAHETILIVDDEQSMVQFLSVLLKREGYEVLSAGSGPAALDTLMESSVDVVVTDLKMPGMDGIELLERIRKVDETLPVIIMTAYASQRSAIDALNLGAFQYMEKHAKNDEIKLVIRNALALRKVRSENSYLKRQLQKNHATKEIIGKSEQMMDVLRMVDKVAETDSTILIYGESGTGKELIAREIHYRSRRSSGPFVSINCGALPKDLLESNLFGHVKGSFTGAVKDQMGQFQVAEGGTFFLDEVGEMQPATQVKLLRALQEREIIPVGGTKPIKIDVRLVAATNADLERNVREGRFRTDLFYRLNVIPVHLPTLRQRVDDIPILANHFLRRFLGPNGPKRLTKAAMETLAKYSWPGNVRELENIMERAVILSDGDDIDVGDLPEKVVRGESERSKLVIDRPDLTLEELEREYILRVLQYTGWQKKRASEILGINASTLYRKLQAYKAQGLVGGGAEEEPEVEEDDVMDEAA